jgi:hypothetical protein
VIRQVGDLDISRLSREGFDVLCNASMLQKVSDVRMTLRTVPSCCVRVRLVRELARRLPALQPL